MAKRKRRDGANTIGGVLQNFIKSNRLDKGLDQIEVKNAWNSVMGQAIVKYTTAVKFERDTLYIALSSSVLREELSYGRDKIIRLLNAHLDKELIKKLVLR